VSVANQNTLAKIERNANIWWYQKNFIKNLTVNYISCANEKPTRICDYAPMNLWHGPLMGRGAWRRPGASLAQFPQISAVQSSPKCTVTQLAVHDHDYLHQDHSAYSNDLTSSVRCPWWWMTLAFFVDAGNRFYLVLCDVINYNDVIFATNSLDFIKDVRFTDI